MNPYDAWKTRTPYKDAVTCPECGEDAFDGTECENCGTYIMTDEDWAEARAEARFDRMRDEGLI